MSYSFALYSIELTSDNADFLLGISSRFADNAEIAYFDRKSGTIVLQFVSTANEEQVKFICDEFKKEVEFGGGGRLTYRVTVTKF
jgi:ethanolamine utilization microcompartment shell protein EutS